MPISWNEIKNRAMTFSKEWAGESSDDAETIARLTAEVLAGLGAEK